MEAPGSSRPRILRGDVDGEKSFPRATDFQVPEAGHVKPIKQELYFAFGQDIRPSGIEALTLDRCLRRGKEHTISH